MRDPRSFLDRLPLLIFLVSLARGLTPIPADAQTMPAAAAIPLTEEVQALVDRITRDYAAHLQELTTLLGAEKVAHIDALAQKERSDARALKAGRQAQAARADLEILDAELSETRLQLQAAIDRLTAQDPALAAQVSAFRDQVTAIAADSDPRRLSALELYADGQREQAIAALIELARAEDAARAARHDAETRILQAQQEAERAAQDNRQRDEDRAGAKEWRRIAALLDAMRDRGEKTLEEVIPALEEAARLDPEDASTWIGLGRLYQDAGRLPAARRAFDRGLAAAATDRDRSDAHIALGDGLVDAGAHLASYEAYAESLDIDRRIAAEDPTSIEAKRNVAISLQRLGDAELAAGDLQAAQRTFVECLEISRSLALQDPNGPQAQHNLFVSLERLGEVAWRARDLPAARRAYGEALEVARRQTQDDPSSVQAQRDLSVGLVKLGDVEQAESNLPAARRAFQESIVILRGLAEKDPRNALTQRQLCIGLCRLGDVELAERDLRTARSVYDDAMGIALRLSSDDPSNAAVRLVLAVCMVESCAIDFIAGDLLAARQDLIEAQELLNSLAAIDPTNAIISDLIVKTQALVATLPPPGTASHHPMVTSPETRTFKAPAASEEPPQ